MIASPGDVPAERKLIRDTINEWNYVNSDSRKIILMPIGWETHSSPEMGDRPQAILNKQILQGCDLLIGVFWTRIGTSTGTHESGTVEEIEEHLKAEKPTMLYFSQTPVELDSVDGEQYEKLKAFKKDCQSRGVYEVYSGLSDFKEKFNRQLQIKINSNEHFQSALSETGSADIFAKEETPVYLSDYSMELLKEAAISTDGTILKVRYMGGFAIQANSNQLNKVDSPRENALWDAAFNELLDEKLIEPRGIKGEVYTVTAKGYEVADTIQEELA